MPRTFQLTPYLCARGASLTLSPTPGAETHPFLVNHLLLLRPKISQGFRPHCLLVSCALRPPPKAAVVASWPCVWGLGTRGRPGGAAGWQALQKLELGLSLPLAL